MKPTTKDITLPSGATCKIRKLCAKDFAYVGNLPDIFSDGGKSAKAEQSKAQMETGLRLTEVILLQCVGPINSDGKPVTVVSKKFHERGENEISVEEFMATEDAAALTQAVLEFSGMTGAAKEAARPFPEEQGGTGNGAPHRSVVPEVAV